MPLNTPVPDTAMPVVEALRRDVPKPEALPEPIKVATDDALRGDIVLRFPARRGGRYGCCPMGLHPQATTDVPGNERTFCVPGITMDAVLDFGQWWDKQTDAKAAVTAVWGE